MFDDEHIAALNKVYAAAPSTSLSSSPDMSRDVSHVPQSMKPLSSQPSWLVWLLQQ